MPEIKVEIIDREAASLLELILEAIISQAVKDPRRLAYLLRAEGSYHIQAGRMECFVKVDSEKVQISRYSGQPVDAVIKGTIGAFFDLGTGKLSPLPFIKGDIRVKGKVKKALNLGLALRGGGNSERR